MEKCINTELSVIFHVIQTLLNVFPTDGLHSSSLESAMPLKEGA